MTTKIGEKQMRATKPVIPAGLEVTPVVKIALMNAVVCWDQHSDDSESDRELHAMAYAQNAGDTAIEQGMGDSAWADAQSTTIFLLQMIGFCK